MPGERSSKDQLVERPDVSRWSAETGDRSPSWKEFYPGTARVRRSGPVAWKRSSVATNDLCQIVHCRDGRDMNVPVPSSTYHLSPEDFVRTCGGAAPKAAVHTASLQPPLPEQVWIWPLVHNVVPAPSMPGTRVTMLNCRWIPCPDPWEWRPPTSRSGRHSDPVGSALGKILRALPTPVAAQAEAVRRATAPAPDLAAARPDPQITTALVDAASAHRTVRLRYRSEAGTEWDAEVEPWAVVVRHGRWYLLCRSLSADARRAYRIDRVLRVIPLAATFVPPAELDPVGELEDHLAVGWEYAVEVIIEAPSDTVVRALPRALGNLQSVDADTTRLVGSTSNPWWYAEQLAAIPVPFHIVQGPELQHTARIVGRRLADAAGPAGPDAGAGQEGTPAGSTA